MSYNKNRWENRTRTSKGKGKGINNTQPAKSGECILVPPMFLPLSSSPLSAWLGRSVGKWKRSRPISLTCVRLRTQWNEQRWKMQWKCSPFFVPPRIGRLNCGNKITDSFITYWKKSLIFCFFYLSPKKGIDSMIKDFRWFKESFGKWSKKKLATEKLHDFYFKNVATRTSRNINWSLFKVTHQKWKTHGGKDSLVADTWFTIRDKAEAQAFKIKSKLMLMMIDRQRFFHFFLMRERWSFQLTLIVYTLIDYYWAKKATLDTLNPNEPIWGVIKTYIDFCQYSVSTWRLVNTADKTTTWTTLNSIITFDCSIIFHLW